MWSPSHIIVTVHRAKGLLIKGKHGLNNCFVIIGLGKEKYQTSVKEKVPDTVEWHEECELAIPSQGNRAELVLTCMHHNSLGIDEFLGQVHLPLNEMDVYERPKSRWLKLQSKPGKEKKKERGELEVRIAFTVKAGSLTDLSKKEKNKSSISNLAASVGGSLLSIGAIEKRKGIKKFAKALGSKVNIANLGKSKKDKEKDDDSMYSGSYSSVGTPGSSSLNQSRQSRQTFGDADPGVISEDEDEFVFDNLSHKSSGSSINMRNSGSYQSSTPDESRKFKSMTLPSKVTPRTIAESSFETNFEKVDEWEQKLYGKHLDIGSTDSLKRMSWRNSQTLQNLEEEEKKKEEALSKSVTAPTTPVLSEKVPPAVTVQTSQPQIPQIEETKPKPTPRIVPSPKTDVKIKASEKLIIEKEKEKEKDKEKDSIKKKIKYFIKDRAESMENLANRKTVANNNNNNKFNNERIIIGGENVIVRKNAKTELPDEILRKYDGKSREDMMRIAHTLENEVVYQKQKVKELEDYLDSLLLKVMECQPRILQTPYKTGTPTKSG